MLFGLGSLLHHSIVYFPLFPLQHSLVLLPFDFRSLILALITATFSSTSFRFHADHSSNFPQEFLRLGLLVILCKITRSSSRLARRVLISCSNFSIARTSPFELSSLSSSAFCPFSSSLSCLSSFQTHAPHLHCLPHYRYKNSHRQNRVLPILCRNRTVHSHGYLPLWRPTAPLLQQLTSLQQRSMRLW